jgi:hypothetical protein
VACAYAIISIRVVQTPRIIRRAGIGSKDCRKNLKKEKNISHQEEDTLQLPILQFRAGGEP